MQYPQIQFYRGSLVRLASGKLKQVEDLSSDDFLESARLVTNPLNGAQSTSSKNGNNNLIHQQQQHLHIDSSVVRDFLEVGPPSSTSPNSPNNSSYHYQNHLNQQHNNNPFPFPSASSSSSSSSASCSPICYSPAANANLTVLIKFFLESSRRTVFIEVPIEHPFFVFHRGWSSWNPQRTFDKFGLKCRKLKIGDTCISLIRRPHQLLSMQPQTKQQESDQCNILFSSIKINE